MKRAERRISLTITLALVALALVAVPARAHCDRINGPVAKDAKTSLETGDIDHVMIWVGEDEEKALRKAFEDALPVYRMEGKAADLAATYFMAEAVRLHREAEGMSFTGLKAAGPVPKDIALAEKALETGNVDPVVGLLSDAINAHTTQLFKKAREARKTQDKSVAAGREWADAYVRYVIYVHKLYQTIQAGPAHGVGE